MPDVAQKERSGLLLRRRLSDFLGNHSAWKRPLRRALKRIERNSWPAVIFGGALRDLIAFGKSRVPRDVDIVVHGVTTSDLEVVFRDLICERNRFGGLRLQTKGWQVDIWGLQDTWAFRNYHFESSGFDSLVRTTFLNVEAIAAEIQTTRGRKRKIFSAGFFEAIENQVLDINFEINPHPALCIVRSILMAIRLDFVLSRRLAEYLAEQMHSTTIAELMEVQEAHYGMVRIRKPRMQELLASISGQLSDQSIITVRLPATRLEQLDLWQYWTPAC
jgi:hypothetical protein